MKCQSYIPVYNSHYDLNIDANGGASPMYNGNVTFQSGHCNNYAAPLSLPQGSHFAYKELLRQTMLFQEETFKDQVRELHHLYRRQKELMGDIKCKDMHMNHYIEDRSSNSTSAKISAKHGENVPHDLPFFDYHSTPAYTGRENAQSSLTSLKEQKVASRHGGPLDDLHFAESKGKRIRGKLLDLELPAEEYIDSDDEKSLLATPPATLLSNKRAKVVVESDVKPSAASRSLNSVLQGELHSSCSYSPTNTYLADLNEPPAISGSEGSGGEKMMKSCLNLSEKNHDLSNTGNTTLDGVADKLAVTSIARSDMAKSEVDLASSGRNQSYYLGQNPPVVQALSSSNSQLSSIKGAKISGRQNVPNKKVDASQWCCSNSRVTRSLKSSCSESKLIENSVFLSTKSIDLISIDLNSASVSNREFTPSCNLLLTGGETLKKSQRCRMIDINLPCDPTTNDEPCDLVALDFKNSGQINLNDCLNDVGLPPNYASSLQTQLEIDLEAPISPEVEERPPPRGDSEENQPEDSCNPLAELANIAAEAIVSISSQYGIAVSQKCEASNSGNNLEWFAGLISSLSIDVDNDFETTSCKDTCSIDDYEAMTLELTEMKAEDYWCGSTVQISSDNCSMLLPSQTRRGTTRRSKRKDFQREVLPSLASLSRYEVTEDIQLIEGLMEAAGTPWQLSRTRRACRMGRKPRVAKQQTFVDVVPGLTAFLCWGKVNRRSRGRRSHTSPTVLSKWLEYVI